MGGVVFDKVDLEVRWVGDVRMGWDGEGGMVIWEGGRIFNFYSVYSVYGK